MLEQSTKVKCSDNEGSYYIYNTQLNNERLYYKLAKNERSYYTVQCT
jgi:hypothetical protein